MKTIGLIGGLSWESSIEYYRIINQVVAAHLGGYHSARSVMISVDFSEVDHLISQGCWDDIADILVSAARKIELCGADFLVLCCNTMHKLADEIQAGIRIPLLHIADATGLRARSLGLDTLGLLGTRITMEDSFYRAHLEDRFGMRILIPDEADRLKVQQVIYNELVHGTILPASRQLFLEIMDGLKRQGAQGIVLGCTEIGSLVKQENASMPLLDTTLIHATAAVDMALAEG